MNAYEAAKLICINSGFFNESEFTDNAPVQSDQEQEARKKELEQRQKELNARKAQRQKEQEKKERKTALRLKNSAPGFRTAFKALSDEQQQKLLEPHFPNWRRVAAYSEYIGFDTEQESLVVINGINGFSESDNEDVFNTKHQKKYVWDPSKNAYDKSKRLEGKWLSASHSRNFPFPYDYYHFFTKTKPECPRIVICEGEKDALNLMCIGINVLTLGGVSNSWEDHAHFLIGKEVYLMFDNDKAGYANALARYYEIKKHTNNVCIVSFKYMQPSVPEKYDVSDYLNAHTFESADDFFEAITYLTTIPSKFFINEIAGHYPDDEQFRERITTLRHDLKVITIEEVFDSIVKKASNIKPNNFREIETIEKELTEWNAKRSEVIGSKGRDFFIAHKEKIALELKHAKEFSKQTESLLADTCLEASVMNNTPFAGYRNILYIWTGQRWCATRDEQLYGLFYPWCRKVGVKQKQQTPDMFKKIKEHLIQKSPQLYLGVEKLEEEGKRIISFLNGSLIIHASGKSTFTHIHNPKNAAFYIIDAEYNPNANPIKFKKFLKRVIPDSLERKALMQFFSYVLYPKHLFSTFLLLYGKDGKNGKSVILELMASLFGKESVSYLNLHEFSGHQLEALEDKMLNIGGEVAAAQDLKKEFSALKTVSGGEATNINPKHIRPYPIEGQKLPKLAFSANKKPTKDIDPAVFRRMLLIGFEQQISNSEVILKLSERIRDEIPGIIIMALKELPALIADRSFARSQNMIDQLEEYKTTANPVLAYIKNNLIKDEAMMIPSKYLYAHYKENCNEEGRKWQLGKENFLREIAEYFFTKEKHIRLHSTEYFGLATRDHFMIGVKFSAKSSIATYTYKNKEFYTSHSNFNIETKTIFVDERHLHN